MLATLNIVTNPFHPNLDRIQKPLRRKVKVNTLVNKHKIDLTKPVICYYNGAPILRAQWSTTTVKDGDIVAFVYLPQGGGGSNPLKLMLMIAISIYAPQLAVAMGATAGTVTASILTVGISFLGNTLVNALIPPPQPPKAQQANAMAAPSPTYSLNAQGNQARIGQAIPVLYGRMKVYPDFAAQPYVEYENNEQYLYQLFVITQGKARVHADEIYIEDSQINSFGTDYQIEVLQPGTSPTLFPTAVFNSTEVNGQELTGQAPSASFGPFPLNPPETLINKIAFDFVLARGIYYLNDKGEYGARSMTFSTFATPINNLGVPTGAAMLLGTHTISGASATPIRRTYKYDITPGRYAVTAFRNTVKNTDSRVANDLSWSGARGYSSTSIDYGNVTMLAVKLKATNTISSQSSRKINCIAQRILQVPVFNNTTGAYDLSSPVETSSIAWAIADMCRAEYGAKVAETRYNIAQLTALNAVYQSRGDTFNAIFDSTQTFWDALSMTCRTGRARPYIQGGMIHFTRDSLQSLPTALFNGRNIVKGSFKLTYIMNSEDTADCVDVEYFDELLWKPRIVRASLDEGAPVKPAKVKAFGITNRAQAYREGMNIAAANRYRRKEVAFETELEGHIPSLGDLIAVQSDIPEWGQHGEIADYTGGVLTVAEPLKWTDGATHFAMFRKANGSVQGPIEVIRGASDDKFTRAVGAPEFNFPIYTGHEKERTYISFGRSGQVVQLCKVLTITPRANKVALSAVNEDVRVHSADGTPVPLDLYNYSIPAPKVKPVLLDFNITQTGSGTTPSIALGWPATAGASRYFIEKSTDSLNWETLGEITSTNFSFVANTGLLYIRVAAFGGVLGPYITKSINIGQVAPPANVTSGAISSNGQSYEVSWAEVEDCDGYFVEVLNAGSVKRSFKTTTRNFSYTLENAIADGGPWRTLQVRIKATKGTVYSNTALTLNGSNAAPSAPTLILNPGAKSVSITVSNCEELDYAGTMIFSSTVDGFTPSDTNKIYEGNGNFFLHVDVDTSRFYKAAHFDTYGKTGLSYSAQYSTTPSGDASGIKVVSTLPDPADSQDGDVVYLTSDDLLYTFNGVAWTAAGSGELEDGSVTEGKLAANAVTAGKIAAGAVTAQKITVANLAAITANMGSISAGNITLDNAGFIKGGQTAYNTGTGFFLGYSATTYKFSLGSTTKGITWDGTNFVIKGDLTAGSINLGGKFTADNNGTISIKSATTGARLEMTNDVIKVFDENGTLRVKLGNLA